MYLLAYLDMSIHLVIHSLIHRYAYLNNLWNILFWLYGIRLDIHSLRLCMLRCLSLPPITIAPQLAKSTLRTAQTLATHNLLLPPPIHQAFPLWCQFISLCSHLISGVHGCATGQSSLPLLTTCFIVIQTIIWSRAKECRKRKCWCWVPFDLFCEFGCTYKVVWVTDRDERCTSFIFGEGLATVTLLFYSML